MGDDLACKLFEAFQLEQQRQSHKDFELQRWTSLDLATQDSWEAAARVAREVVKGNVLGELRRNAPVATLLPGDGESG